MSITRLSTELLQKIYEFATIKDVVALSKTSKKNHDAYIGRQLPILQTAFYNSPYSPFPELVKLYVSEASDTIRKPVGTEVRRRHELERVIRSGAMTNLTLPAIKKMVSYAHVAERWVEIFPQLRWRHGSSNRRLLHAHEAERLRKAIYQLWTYHNLFHDRLFCEFAQGVDLDFLPMDDLRLRLMRTWSTIDIIRQREFVVKMEELFQLDIFPSNKVIQDNHMDTLSVKTIAKLGWGDVQNCMHLTIVASKLSPEDVLHLYQNTNSKPQRAEYLHSKGEWFLRHDETWNHVMRQVLEAERPYYCNSFPTALYRRSNVLEDDDVEFGVCAPDGPGYYDKHLYANDSSPSGERDITNQVLLAVHGLWLDADSSSVVSSSLSAHDSDDRSVSEDESIHWVA